VDVGASDRERLEAAVAAQESLRGTIPDDIVDTAIRTLRAQLDAVSSDRRRRQATVLFADVTGFTAMSETMDAEELTVLMDRLWTVLDKVVIEHGGHVDKHIGDALMAVWGAHTTREDDPEQAVRAALSLQVALDRFRRENDTEFGMRVGVNTGPVALGSVGVSGEFTAMGDAVNVASRLEHAARSNSVLVSHDTYRHVRGVFDAAALPPLAVRGKSALLRVYEIRALKPRAFRNPSRGVEGIETTMVGRKQEFDTLRAAFQRCQREPGHIVVELVGEAGIGKSRLLWEFENWVEIQPESVFFFSGRAVSQRRSVPLALIRDMIANRFEIVDSDDPLEVVAKLTDGTSDALEAQDAAVLAFWLGFGLDGQSNFPTFPEGERLALAARAHLARVLETFAADSPVVMLLEDLHWADDSSLEMLRRLLEGWRDLPLLMVVATRPLERFHDTWLAPDPERFHQERLGPITTEQARLLLTEILQRAGHVPEALIDLIATRSEGNAFYLEELVKMLIDDGAIDVSKEQWTIHLDGDALAKVPATLTGVLQARLDSLPLSARKSVQQASVVGRIFWDDAVEELGGGRSDLEPALSRELIFQRRPSAFAESSEFIFKHALLHDVTYETVLLSERPQMHLEAAQWLERTVGARRDEYLIELAGHRRLANDAVSAADLLASAAELALRAGDAKTCLRLAEESFLLRRNASVPVDPRLLAHTVRAHRVLGDLEDADEAAAIAIDAARALGDDVVLANALVAAADVAQHLGDNDRWVTLLDQALVIAERVGGSTLAETLIQLAWVDVRGNRPANAESMRRLLELVAELGDPQLASKAHQVAGVAAQSRNDFDEGLRHMETALDISRRMGDRFGEALGLLNFGASLHSQGDRFVDVGLRRRAEAQYLAALELSERFEMKEQAALIKLNLGQLKLRLGDVADAFRLARQGLKLALEIHAVPMQLFALLVHAEALIESGEVKTGAAHIGLAQIHPASDGLADEIERIMRRLDDLDDLEASVAAGRDLVFDQVMAAILASDESLPADA
jgi:class 3 adenylate cyclase/tetratricopeptide (TPR) repeat protein